VKRKWKLAYHSHLTIEQIAEKTNPIIRGWFQYYGKFSKEALQPLANYINDSLMRWARRKYKYLHGKKEKAFKWLKTVFDGRLGLFAHWKMFKVY